MEKLDELCFTSTSRTYSAKTSNDPKDLILDSDMNMFQTEYSTFFRSFMTKNTVKDPIICTLVVTLIIQSGFLILQSRTKTTILCTKYMITVLE
jgi:hypothetical protein